MIHEFFGRDSWFMMVHQINQKDFTVLDEADSLRED